MKRQYVSIGIDIGTGGCKTTIIGDDGFIVSGDFQEYPTACPKPLWSEQDPDNWYNAFLISLKVALEKDVIRPAILWTDQRSSEQSNRLKKKYGNLFLKIGYNQVNPTWTISMLAWIRENEPQIWNKISKLMLPKDYIRFKLTGRWATDWTDAAGTLLTDIAKNEWSDALCEIITLSKDVLPEILSPMEVAGEITKQAAVETNLLEGTPVVAGSSDPAAEIFGTGMFQKNQLTIKLATAGVVFLITEKPTPHPKILTYPHVIPGMWFSVAGTNSCCSSVRWFRDIFCMEEMAVAKELDLSPYELMDREVDNVDNSSDGLMYHPYLLGERSPYWDPNLRGSFTGIRMSHQKKHFIRSIFEGVSFSVKDCLNLMLNVMEKKGIEVNKKGKAILLGGGSKSKIWSQILSDVLGNELRKLESVDASFGAALIGGVGVSLFKNPQEAVNTCVRIADTIKPDFRNNSLYTKRFTRYKKIHDALADIYMEM